MTSRRNLISGCRRIAVLSGFVLFCVCSSHGWGSGHATITQAAFGALPEWQRAHWQASEAGLRSSYCFYVDMGLENAEAKPYLVVVKGRLFRVG